MTANQAWIIQLRAEGLSYRQVTAITGIAPHRVARAEREAMRKAVQYLQAAQFLEKKNPA